MVTGERKMAPKTALVLALAMAVTSLMSPSSGALQAGYYKGKCRAADVEAVVARVVAARFASDPTITAGLLRLQFHDCFVNVSYHIVWFEYCKCKKRLGLDLPFRLS